MERTFEATIEKRDKWYIGWVDAVPGAFSQGKTIKEVQENLVEAVQLILGSQRELKDSGVAEKTVKRKIRVQVQVRETSRPDPATDVTGLHSSSGGRRLYGFPQR